jgi:hypothetical protein
VEQLRTGRNLLVAAYGSFVAANLIHNQLGLDPAVIPSGLFVALMLWKPHRGFLIAGAICIAAPALGFFKLNAILQPTTSLRFMNHLFLFSGGVLALAAGASGVVRLQDRAHA